MRSPGLAAPDWASPEAPNDGRIIDPYLERGRTVPKNIQEAVQFSPKHTLCLPNTWNRAVHCFAYVTMLIYKAEAPTERFQPRDPDPRPIRVGQAREKGIVPVLGVQGLNAGRDVLEGVPQRVRRKSPGEEARGGARGGGTVDNLWITFTSSLALLFEGWALAKSMVLISYLVTTSLAATIF